MSYIINNSRGQIVAVVGDGTVNTSATDLALIGRAVTNFGDFQNENYIYLLENFANSTAPLQPVLGQLWYDSGNDKLYAYSTANTWVGLASEDYVQLQKISPVFTGVPTAPTATSSTNTTQLATTAFVQNNKVNPVFTGTPTAPTAAISTNTTQLATTAFVQNQLSSAGGFVSAGTISAAGFATNGALSATGNVLGGNIATGGNVVALGQISSTGNVTGNYIFGNGALLTGVITSVANINNGTSNVTVVSSGGNITVGVNGLGNVVVFANTGAYVAGVVSVSGNVTGGNVQTAGLISATGNIIGGNLISVGTITANNIIANNISTSGTNAFRLPNLTDAEIFALSPLNGDLVYNTTTGYAQVYQQGVWVEITVARYS